MALFVGHVKSLPRRLWVAAETLKNGRMNDAVEALSKVYDAQNWLDRILMASLLLNVKGPSHAGLVLTRAVQEKDLPSDLRVMAHGSLGTSLAYRNRFGDAVKAFERALYFAQKTNDLHQLSEVRLALLAAKVDCFGPTAVGTLMADAFRTVQAAGDPHLLSLLHYRCAVVEGRRGAMDIARRHIDLALDLLEKRPNPWIESCVRLTASTIAFVSADLVCALDHTERAIELSRRCGAIYYELGALCNAAQICLTLGRLDQASRYLDAADPSMGEIPFLKFCLCDTRAQLQLAIDDLAGCHETLVALTNQIAQSTEDDQSFPQLDSLATRIKLLHRQGHLDEALNLAEQTAATARTRGERPLETTFHILRAGLLVDLTRIDEASEVASLAMTPPIRAGVDSLTTRAELEHVRGRILHNIGAPNSAIHALKRSARLHASVGNSTGCAAAIASMKLAISSTDLAPRRESRQEAPVVPSDLPESANLIDALASLSTLGGHPDLLGGEAFEILVASGATNRLALIATTELTQTIVREHNWPNAVDGIRASDVMSLPLGTAKGSEFSLVLEPRADSIARSCLTSLETLIQMAVARDEHRREKLRHGSVWPVNYYVGEAGDLFSGQRMNEVLAQAMRAAKSPLTILLTGETGVGKEVLAREIHRLSLRAEQTFQPVVCAGMVSGLLESQLFGHKKGSFTGAVADFPGVIQGAKGGTLFLDEIGELSTELQVKLLRFLESKEIHPLGELRPFKVDVRVIAATNANLQQLVEEGKFREDLYYRLNIATFDIPPLRERREEIPALARHFLVQYSQQNHKPVPRLSDEALEYLVLYRWPGNVRELRNEMERLAGMADAGGTIEPCDLKPAILSLRTTNVTTPNLREITIRVDQPLHEAVDHLEKEMIRRALNGYQGNLESAARALGLSRKGLYHKRQRLGML